MLSTILHPSKYLFWWLTGTAIVAITFFHIWQLTNIPRGLYVDESSVGYNAALIAQTLHDEHGTQLPIYFKAFGEYKHPLYIYATAALFRLFGIHEFLLRFTSFIFFATFLGILAIFARTLYKSIPAATFVVLAAGLLPWFFPMSRIAFEVVSGLPVIVGALLCTYLALHRKGHKQDWYAVLAGALIGLSIYTYSSSKLWAPLQLLGIGFCYLQLTTARRLVLMAAAAILVSLPAIQFSANHPDALGARFRSVTYLYDQSQTLSDKALIFAQNYSRHFGLPFLIWTGDTNLRHATGYGGELFGIVAALAGAGIVYSLFFTKAADTKRFYVFLLFNLAIAPIPAAVTLGDTGHSLRTTLMGIIWLLFAGYGLQRLVHTMHAARKHIFIATVFVILVVEAGLYIHHYFTSYTTTTSIWFDSFGFRHVLDTALSQHPEHILVSSQANASYIQTAFYGQILRELKPTYITTGPPIAAPKTCLIFFNGNKIHNPLQLESTTFPSLPGSQVRLRCYADRQ